MLPIGLIDPPKSLLGPFKPRAIVSLELLEQVKRDGNVSQSLLVRPREGGRYEVVDGFTRYNQLKAAGTTEVPCIIQDLDDKQALVKQVQLNSTRRETEPLAYLQQFIDLTELDPTLTVADLANLVTKSEKWVRNIMRLSNLTPKAQLLVKRGEITASNAYLLARVNQSFQDEYIESACTLSARDFKPMVAEVVNRHREAIKEASLKRFHGGQKNPHMRPMRQIKEELDTGAEGRVAIFKYKLTTPEAAWDAAVRWVMSLDPESLEDYNQKFIEREERRTKQIEQLRERNHRFDT